MSGPQLGRPGERLYPSCARFGPLADVSCRHCGYNFDGGAGSSWHGAPVLADQSETKAISNIPQAQPRRSWPGRAIAAVILIAVIGSLVPILNLFESATQLIEDLPGDVDVDIPDITIPNIDTNVTDPFGTDAGSYGKCKGRIMRYMRQFLAKDGTGSRPLNELFIEASVKLGAGTFEYRSLVSVFSKNQGTALAEGTRAGLRGAERDTNKACRSYYND